MNALLRLSQATLVALIRTKDRIDQQIEETRESA